MFPVKISAKLSTSRRNIISAIEKMESINDCFLLEKELRGVVQKGMLGRWSSGGRVANLLSSMRLLGDSFLRIAAFRDLSPTEIASRRSCRPRSCW
ncbi:unnamed protein product [Scytosiphon promiscuus]